MSTFEYEKQARRRKKRLRNDSSSEISVEELYPDEMGYDGDVEALHPDGYEEPESETEVCVTPRRKFHSIDDELAARMKHLGSDRSGTNSPMTPSTTTRGRKRRNLHEDVPLIASNGHSDLEVMEVPSVDHATKSPPKKRRRRSKPGSSSQRSDNSLSRTHDKLLLKENDPNDAMDLT